MRFIISLLFMLCAGAVFSQSDTIIFSPASEIPYPAPYSCFTARFDALHRPYLYTANQEFGLIVFDISDVENPKTVCTLSQSQFQNLKPTDLVQQGNYLYVSLGGFAGLFPQNAGMAVVDASNPAQATIAGIWTDAAFNRGCAAVRVKDNFAYLGAMEKGVVILEISNPALPKYFSHITLDLGWPSPPGIFTTPNARGLAIRGDEVWTCFDAGGLRLVDAFFKQNPVEAYMYVNENLYADALVAYNTALIVGNYLYIAVDFCGIDIVDISKPTEPVNAGWINPWNCAKTNWNGRPGHTNQLATACNNRLLFASGADTEVLAWSLTDPVKPKLLGQHTILKDSVATWGIDVNDSLVVLAQLWNPLDFPYIAKKGGIRLLRWSCPQTISSPEKTHAGLKFSIRPNPVSDRAQAVFDLDEAAPVQWSLIDINGREIRSGSAGVLSVGQQVLELNFGGLPAGAYGFRLMVGGEYLWRLAVKQ